MLRMRRAKEMKDQKQLLEEQLFQREKKWKGQITQPKEPKLSAFINKKEREVDQKVLKALSKPVDIMSQYDSTKSKISQSVLDPNLSQMMPSNSVEESKKLTQEYFKRRQQNKDKYIEIKPEMSYDDAISLIH